jgi:hypothetical protein
MKKANIIDFLMAIDVFKFGDGRCTEAKNLELNI